MVAGAPIIQRTLLFTLAALLGAVTRPVPAKAQITPTFNDVPYAVVPLDAGGTMTVFLDVYMPTAGTPPHPLLLWIHGGGWQGGTHNNVPAMALQLRDQGFFVASVNYRLSGSAVFPAQIHDVKGAVRFLRANAATYSLDVNRFGSWGTSAGGHLSALLATSGDAPALEGTSGGNLAFSSAVQAAVDFFGPTDILNMQLDVTTPPGGAFNHDDPGSPESHLVGWDAPGQGIGNIRANLANPTPPYPALVQLCMQVNPITWLTPGDPPLFISHGTSDTAVPIRQSVRLCDAMYAANLYRDYRPVTGAGHGPLGATTEAAARAFLMHRLTLIPSVPGDLNCDGILSAADLEPMVLALMNPAGHTAAFPSCDIGRADCNSDQRLDGGDIRAFVEMLVP